MKWRIFTFSLRRLLIAIALVAVLCALFGARVHQHIRERQVAAKVQRLGGSVVYGYPEVSEELSWPAWLATILAYDDFSCITFVDFSGTNATDQDLADLTELAHLERVSISRTSITDDGLELIASLPRIQMVQAFDTKVGEGFVADLLAQRPSLVIYWSPSVSRAKLPTATERQNQADGLGRPTSLRADRCRAAH